MTLNRSMTIGIGWQRKNAPAGGARLRGTMLLDGLTGELLLRPVPEARDGRHERTSMRHRGGSDVLREV